MGRDQWETLLAVDDMMSGVLTTLQETGRANNTLVIFTSDNGLSNRSTGGSPSRFPTRGLSGFRWFVRLPGQIPAGTVSRRSYPTWTSPLRSWISQTLPSRLTACPYEVS